MDRLPSVDGDPRRLKLRASQSDEAPAFTTACECPWPSTCRQRINSLITLYAYPGACSTISHIALEMAQADYTVAFVNLPGGEQRLPTYLQLNPRGKVPVLTTPGGNIVESVAILSWIARQYPNAGILPDRDSDLAIAALSDLAWFASTVHPLITRLLLPTRFALPECQDGVRDIARNSLTEELALADRRLFDRTWWVGTPSALDAYLFVLWQRVIAADIDVSAFANIARHAAGFAELPAVQRALEKERAYLQRPVSA